jgi:putative transposase
MLLTLRFRLRDKHAAELNRQAQAVNSVWNYCNNAQRHARDWGQRWPSAFDLQKLTAGAGPILGLHAHTIQQVCTRYARSRQQHKRPWLRWRGRNSLGWVPFNTGHVKAADGLFRFRGMLYEPMHTRKMPAGAVIGAGSFSADAKGHWYINLPIEFPEGWFARAGRSTIGVDLGLKTLATLSDGQTVERERHFDKMEQRLAVSQRARKKRRSRTINASIANARKDYLHKTSATLAKAHDIIIVGDVSSSKLSRTDMAKSVQDASWYTFKRCLSYKAIRHGGKYLEVSEYNTTQICSECGALPDKRPKGIGDLGIREWTCGECGAHHNRDINAAKNILARGLASLAEGAR